MFSLSNALSIYYNSGHNFFLTALFSFSPASCRNALFTHWSITNQCYIFYFNTSFFYNLITNVFKILVTQNMCLFCMKNCRFASSCDVELAMLHTAGCISIWGVHEVLATIYGIISLWILQKYKRPSVLYKHIS